ncbi:MAG: hypothetical protein HYR88_13165, partial [Verrucomicrobia bacterium]|nr:hypothetical protein [Verrucomicrobiota bacterium]
DSIRFGLAAIKGVGEIAVESILKARSEGGRLNSLEDFCERVDLRVVNKRVLEALVRCGACDSLGANRATMFASIERTLARASSVAADRARGQTSLFGGAEAFSQPQTPNAGHALPEWPQHELLAAEKELLGFYVTGHPLTPYADLLGRFCLHDSITAKQLPSRSVTRIGGMVSTVQSGLSKKTGKPYAMVTLEDLHGSMSLLCMNENHDKYRDLLTPNKALLIVAEVNNDEDKPKLFPQEIMPLEDAPKRYTTQVHLKLNEAHLSPTRLEEVRQLLERHPGRVPLFLCIRRIAGERVFIEVHEKWNVRPSRELEKESDELFGEETYYARVDTRQPEKAVRKWERKPGGSDDE